MHDDLTEAEALGLSAIQRQAEVIAADDGAAAAEHYLDEQRELLRRAGARDAVLSVLYMAAEEQRMRSGPQRRVG